MKFYFVLLSLVCLTLLFFCQCTLKTLSSAENSDKSNIVLSGVVKIEDDKFVLKYMERGDLSITDKSATRKFKPLADDETVKFDIINCGGFLASAKGRNVKRSPTSNNYDWEVDIISETIAPDVSEKVKQCQTSADSNSFNSNAFAVFSNIDRSSIKTTSLPDKKLFLSLPINVQTWATEGNEAHSRNFAALSIKSGDFWADADGDGKIDLVAIIVNCNGDANTSLTCHRLLRWYSTGWSEISYFTPA